MTKKSILISIALICILAFAGAAYFNYRNGAKISSDSEGLRNFRVTSITLDSTAGWGYRIYQDTVPVIEQRFIPGVPGNAGFKSEEQAIKTGNLVISKLEKGVWPPSVTEEELDSLEVNYKK